jgi:hypothetical protein
VVCLWFCVSILTAARVTLSSPRRAGRGLRGELLVEKDRDHIHPLAPIRTLYVVHRSPAPWMNQKHPL